MSEHRREWAQARDRLTEALIGAGFPGELGDLLARQLRIPKAMDRLSGYIRQARPRSVEMLVDEVFAINAEIDAWRQRKEARDAQASYWAMRYAGFFGQEDEEDGGEDA